MSKKKKKILLLSDDLRLHSGIATMSKELVLHTVHKYDWIQVGGAVKHPDEGKFFDLSEDIKKETGVEDANVKIIPVSGYGNPEMIRHLLVAENIDAILHFTDPRFWQWLYEMEDEIRRHVPIFYYNIWDDLPDPQWNAPFYASCDLLMGISKQTYGINKRVIKKFGEDYEDWQIKYVPHGVSEKFYPIHSGAPEYSEVNKLRDALKLNNKKFIILYNNRNIRRKNPGDVVLAYKEFCDKLTKEQAKECCLLMHTQPVDNNGTHLPDVIDNICPDYDVVFTNMKFDTSGLNLLYNLVDVTVNMASNEGFGLATCESMKAGTPIVVNVTGGLQDQCGFKWIYADGKGLVSSKFITADDYIDLGSLHDKKKLPEGLTWGNWVKPVWPSNRSLQGSPATPYIFDDRCDYEEVAEKFKEWYDTPKDKRQEFGLEGWNFTNSKDSNMSATNMGRLFVESMEGAFKNWKPKNEIVLCKI
jgi:glycosyltransferase involved in cell wall biosynthesis